MKTAHAPPIDPAMLVALDVLLAEQNVTRAARRLGVTQSAASHRLRQLREALGDPLLVPGAGGLVPTARAQAIAGPLRRALADLSSAVQAGRPFEPATATRTFTLSCRDYGEFTVVGHLFDAVVARAPGVALAVLPPDPRGPEQLAAGTLDLHVGIPIPAMAGLRQRTILREPYVVVARQGHPAFVRKMTLARYLAHPHLIISPGGRGPTPIDGLLAQQGKQRHVALRVTSFVSAPFLVARTDLLLTAPLGLAVEASRHVPLVWAPVPLVVPPSEVVMVWHERAEHDAGHAWLRALLVETVKALKPPRAR